MFRHTAMTGIRVVFTTTLLAFLLPVSVRAERSESEKSIQKWHERNEEERWLRTTEPAPYGLHLRQPGIPLPHSTRETMFERTVREREQKKEQERQNDYQEYIAQEKKLREQLGKHSQKEDEQPLPAYTPSWPPPGLPPDPAAWGNQNRDFPESLREESKAPVQTADIDLPLEAPVVSVMISRQWPELKRMLVSGTSPDTLSRAREPLIVLAARRDLGPAVDILLQQKARINATDSFGNTALMWAADQDNLQLLEKLLDAGAKPDLQNRQGLNALMRAARRGNAGAVELLLKQGIDTDATDYTGRNALEMARENGHVRTIRALQGVSPSSG